MTIRSLCLWGAIAGLVLAKGLTVLVQQGATLVPDPATGRTGPYLFAAAISQDFSYIKPWQGWLLTAVYATAILSFLVWAGLGIRERFSRRG